MFNFFKKQPPQLSEPAKPPPLLADASSDPRKHHYGFTHTFVPSLTITDERRGVLLAGLASGRGQEVMRQAWLKFGPELGAEIVPGDLLEVHAFQHESCLCVVLLFPPPLKVGEAHAGLVIAGPVAGFRPEALTAVPVRYFVLELAAAGTTWLREWTPNGFTSLGPGPANTDEFTDVVFAHLFSNAPSTAHLRKICARSALILELARGPALYSRPPYKRTDQH